MTSIFILLFFAYLVSVVVLTGGWHRTIARIGPTADCPEIMISVVIPVRDEGSNIAALLGDIINQSHANFEVIVVNDHSRDETKEIVSNFTRQHPSVALISSQGEGKKKALTTGINASRGEIIVTTDGDCRVGQHWLRSIAKYFKNDQTQMVFGAVKLEGASFFSALQAHEFLSLVGTAAATLWFKAPSMCNGANLAFRKTTFFEVGGYANNINIPSGDDEFLMRKIFESHPDGIHFVNDNSSVVATNAMRSLKEFTHQRVRWAGKWRHAPFSWNAVLAIFIFCFQLSVLSMPVALVSSVIDPGVTILFLFKFIIEWIFLKKVADFVKVKWNWSAFVFLQIFYPVYAIWIGVISSFTSFEWKGRRLNSLTVSRSKS
ncbi:MAG TPA: glycosyltransferase [Chryseolinea sp.]